MNSPLRHLRSHAISYLALVIALGGTSYAATALPKDSVTAKQIKANAVRSSEVKDRSLLKKDFKPGQLPRGPRGLDADQIPVPNVRVILTADVATAENTAPAIAFDTDDYDPFNMHTPAFPTRLVAPVSGVYQVSATVNWLADDDGVRGVEIRRNGTPNETVAASYVGASPALPTVQNITGEVRLDAGEFVTVNASQINAGNPLAVRGVATPITFASMSFVSP